MNNKDKTNPRKVWPILRPVRDYFEPSEKEKAQHLIEAMKGFLGNFK